MINISNFSENQYFCHDLKLVQVDKQDIINHKTYTLPVNEESFLNQKSNPIASSLETLLYEEDRTSPEVSEQSRLIFDPDYGPNVFQKLCDQCNECKDCCCRSLGYFDPCEIFPNLSDKKSLIKAETRNLTPSSNEALIADAFDDLDENNPELAINEGYNLERDEICPLLEPNKSDYMLDVYPNPDSDRDSGCFSEEQNIMDGMLKQRAYSKPNCVTECDIDTPTIAQCRLRDVMTAQPRVRRGLSAEVSKPVHSRYLAARPFHRKIWKRRNGWYKVRREESLPPSFPSQPTNYADSDSQQLRSQLSGPSFEFLRDTAAKECETGREQELSDNDPDYEDTIESDVERMTSPSSIYSGDCVADILSNMRIEIARMVAESAEASLLDNNDEGETEEHSEWSQSESCQEQDFSSEPEDDMYFLNDSAE